MTVKIPDDYKLVSFDVKSLFTSIPLQLVLDCTATVIKNCTTKLPLPTDVRLTFSTAASTTNGYMEQLWAHQFPLL